MTILKKTITSERTTPYPRYNHSYGDHCKAAKKHAAFRAKLDEDDKAALARDGVICDDKIRAWRAR